MPRIAYVNGRYLPHRDAVVHVEDRGYQFADGVYEVICVRDGRLVEAERHHDRLERSLGELRISAPMSRRALAFVVDRVIARNALRNGFVYLQVSRGVAARDHAFPRAAEPSLVLTVRHTARFDATKGAEGVAVITTPDLRWKRADIKTVSLLPNVLAKQAALDAGAFDTWMVDSDGLITEGTASNAWIVDRDGTLRTRAVGYDILNGVTRLGVLDVVRETGVPFETRPFSPDEAAGAREAFLTSSTNWVRPVVAVDGRRIGDGAPGPLTRRLLAGYVETVDG